MLALRTRLPIAPARYQATLPTLAHVGGGGAHVGGGLTASLIGGGLGLFGIYLMIFGSPVTQPIGIVLGMSGLIVGAALERSGY